jgi:chromosome segregation ATPase
MTTATATGALGRIRERRAALEPQISAATREIQAMDTKIADLDLKRRGGDKRAPAQLDKVREPYQEKAHARARLVQEDGRLRIEALTLEKEVDRFKEQLETVDNQLMAFAPVMPELGTLRGLLRDMDAAMVRNPQYQGNPSNSYRVLLGFLSQPDELLQRREALAQRIAELGDAV